MGRGRGRAPGAPTNLDKMAIAAFSYRKNTDPTGLLRHRGLGRNKDPMEDVPKLPAIPVYGHVEEYRFTNALHVDTTNVWNEVAVNAGTPLAVQDERGGVAKFVNDTGDNDNYYYIGVYEFVLLNSSKDVWLITRIRILDVSEADWFVGLTTKAMNAANELFDSREDSIGFYGADGSANINAECNKDSSATQETALGTLTDDTFMDLKFHVVNTSTVEFFINNQYVATIPTNLPDDEEMAFAFGCRNGTGGANAMSIGRTIIIMDE